MSRGPAQGQGVEPPDFGPRSPRRFAGDPPRRAPGHLAHEWVVQEKEGLRKPRPTRRALPDDRAGVGPVEKTGPKSVVPGPVRTD